MALICFVLDEKEVVKLQKIRLHRHLSRWRSWDSFSRTYGIHDMIQAF